MTYNWQGNPDLSAKSDQDHLKDIISALDTEILKHHDDFKAIFLRANAYLDSGKYLDAITDYLHILENEPKHPTALNNLGICYRSLGDPEKAIDKFNQAINLNPNYRDAFNNRGMAFSDMDKMDEAINDFNKAIELDSKYWYAFSNRGMAFWAIGKKQEAFSDYETAKNLQNL